MRDLLKEDKRHPTKVYILLKRLEKLESMKENADIEAHKIIEFIKKEKLLDSTIDGCSIRQFIIKCGFGYKL